MSFQIRFQGDVPHSRWLTAECEASCDQLRAEFPEILSFEVSLSRTGEQFEVHVHVTGRQISLAAKAQRRSLGEALHAAFARTERQLRKRHDKQIFARRRETQRYAAP
jgi:ribosome-associated translation inhibitor RaiA